MTGRAGTVALRAIGSRGSVRRAATALCCENGGVCFTAAVFAGRLVRFLGEGYLAVKLGDRAAETLTEHYPSIAGALAAAVLVYLLLRRFVHSRRPSEEKA